MGGTAESPVPGWAYNDRNGMLAFLAGAGRAIFRSLPASGHLTADIVPADMLASLLVAAASATANTRKFEVYHFTSGEKNPIKWSDYCRLAIEKMREFPCSELAFYPRAKCRSNFVRNKIFYIVAHYIPAIFLDLLLRLSFKKPVVFAIQRKYTKGMLHSAYFTRREWHFSTKNTQALVRKLLPEDKEEFRFNIADLDWIKYTEDSVLGIRRFYHKQSPDSLEDARKELRTKWFIEKVFWISVFLLTCLGLASAFESGILALLVAGLLALFCIWF